MAHILPPEKLIHELPAFSIHSDEDGPHQSEDEHWLDISLELLRCLRRLFDNPFERAEFLEVTIQNIHQALY